jgi:preprotein translocase subunit SecF
MTHTNIHFIRYSRLYYIFFGILIAASIFSFFSYGLKFGIEFTGGTLLEIQFQESRPSNEAIRTAVESINLGEMIVQPAEDNSMLLKFKPVDEATHQEIINKIKEIGDFQEKRFDFIGPSVGEELIQKTQAAILLVLVAITLYITFAFRKVSRPVSSYKYGITSLIALLHDVIIPLGAFSFLGHYFGTEITIPIIAALLTVIGFSVHDTIVIFDRIRENIIKRSGVSFEDTVNWSLNQTLIRSINTTLTVLVVLFSIFLFGGETLKDFALALIIGICAGTYSSIFIASPLLVSWYKWGIRKR